MALKLWTALHPTAEKHQVGENNNLYNTFYLFIYHKKQYIIVKFTSVQ